MPKFTTLPLEVEAEQFLGIDMGVPKFSGDPDFNIQSESCPEWIAIAFASGGTSDNGLWVSSDGGSSWGGSNTLHLKLKVPGGGEVVVPPGAWLVQDSNGTISVEGSDTFPTLYQPVVAEATKGAK